MSSEFSKTLSAEDLQGTFEAFNRHDIDGVMKHFSEDCVFYSVEGPEVYGSKIEGKQAIAEAFCNVWENMPDAHWEQHCHFVHSDRAVSEWTFSGTGTDGRRVEAQGADIFTLRNGEIIVKQAFRKNRPPIEV